MPDLTKDAFGEIDSLREKAVEMLKHAQLMFRTCLDGFLKHDLNILKKVLKDETRITGIYNDLTAYAVEIAKKRLSKKASKEIHDLVNIICAIERIGDSCVSLTERIEYKIQDNVLFSEKAVEEYRDLHNKIDKVLSGTIKAIMSRDKKSAKSVLKSSRSLHALGDKYRATHIERSAKGLCDDWARIRYLDMVDFTEETLVHSEEILNRVR